MEIAESGQTRIMEKARSQPDLYTTVRKSGKVVVVYATDVAVGNNMKQTRMRSFLTDPATEIRLITYLWMLELSPMVRPHNVKMKFMYAHGGLNPGEYESEQDVNWSARGGLNQ